MIFLSAFVAPISAITYLSILSKHAAIAQPFTADPSCLDGNARMLSLQGQGIAGIQNIGSEETIQSSNLESESDTLRNDNNDGSQLRGSNGSMESKRILMGKMEDGGGTEHELVFRFNLRMFWSEGYCWQEEAIERRWCLACPGNICNENDVLWVMDCDITDPKQHFVFTQADAAGGDFMTVGGGGRLSPYTRPDLCWHRVDGAETQVEYKLRPCATTNDDQVFDGFSTTVEFELHPRQFPDHCMTQAHHPKREEFVFREDCTTAQKDNTSLWVVDGGSFVPPPAFVPNDPTDGVCQYEPLLESNQRLAMNERVEVSYPIDAYIVMQNDGNLVVWSGTRKRRGKVIWKSGVSISPSLGYQFTTVLQGDGHMLTYYPRPDGSGRRNFVFRSLSVSAAGGGSYFLAVNCDGRSLSIFRRLDGDSTGESVVESVWTTEPR